MMITIRNKQFSEETIIAALQKHCNFEGKKYIFKAGDVARHQDGSYRIIIGFSHPISYDLYGNKASNCQKDFEFYGYKKVGILNDFIKD